MKDGQGLSANWGTNSDLPHRSRQGCNFSLTECHESPRDVFPQELSDLNGPNFLTSCLSYVTLSSGTSVETSCASVSERIHSSSSNCFLVASFSFFKNFSYVLSRKRQVSCHPLDCKKVEHPKQASALAGSCKGDDGLPFASRTRCTHWRQFDVEQRRNT